MTTMATEFEIVVSDRQVSGSFGPASTMPSETPSADLDPNDLTVDVVELMERWLNFWLLISRAGIRHADSLFERKTFEVVGRQLWDLILDNEVGESLLRHLDDPDDQPLRLILTFTNRADARLRGMPWEFLFHRRHGFLAAKTGLVLTRYVHLEESDGRPTVTPVQNDQLRVLPLVALPKERRFAGVREDLAALRDDLRTITQLQPLDPIEAWDVDRVREALSDPDKPCHVVHLFGICKGPPGEPRLLLGGGEDGFRDPQELVDGLTSGPIVPQLVVLQLCDYEDGDASENFERLAPALVEKGVPAVLALQYADDSDGSRGTVGVTVGRDFYLALAHGTRVGEAVQECRAALARTVDRRFATPVLYLGNDGALWKNPQPQPQASTPTTAPATTSGPRDFEVRALLADVVRHDDRLDDERRSRLLNWLGDLPLDGDAVARARESIRLAIGGAADDQTREEYGRMLERLQHRSGARR